MLSEKEITIATKVISGTSIYKIAELYQITILDIRRVTAWYIASYLIENKITLKSFSESTNFNIRTLKKYMSEIRNPENGLYNETLARGLEDLFNANKAIGGHAGQKKPLICIENLKCFQRGHENGLSINQIAAELDLNRNTLHYDMNKLKEEKVNNIRTVSPLYYDKLNLMLTDLFQNGNIAEILASIHFPKMNIKSFKPKFLIYFMLEFRIPLQVMSKILETDENTLIEYLNHEHNFLRDSLKFLFYETAGFTSKEKEYAEFIARMNLYFFYKIKLKKDKKREEIFYSKITNSNLTELAGKDKYQTEEIHTICKLLLKYGLSLFEIAEILNISLNKVVYLLSKIEDETLKKRIESYKEYLEDCHIRGRK